MGGLVKLLAMLLLAGVAWPAEPRALASEGAACEIRSIAFSLNGVPAPLVTAGSGDRVAVSFEVPDACERRLTLASFVAPAPAFDGSRLDQQVVFSRQRGTFGPGRHSLTVQVFDFRPVAPATCREARADAEAERDELRQTVRRAMAASPAYREQVVEEVREQRAKARTHPTGPYLTPCDGSEAGSGGKPCDGCVGNAGDKTPPGQALPGTDRNAGYQCDQNQGIGRGNPAHDGCPNFQLDLSYTASEAGQRPHLIAGLFCVRTQGECYVTDRTDSEAVVGSLEPAGRRP